MTEFEAADEGSVSSAPPRRPATSPDHPTDRFDGFEDWYLAAWPRVQRILTAYCGSQPLATEAAAEAFVAAAERWPDPARRPRNPDAWVVTVAFNRLKKHHRRAKRERDALSETPPPPSPDRDLDLWVAVGNLPRGMHQVLVLRYVGDLTEPMIAEVMGRSIGYVSSALTRARKRLQSDVSLTLDPGEHPRERN